MRLGQTRRLTLCSQIDHGTDIITDNPFDRLLAAQAAVENVALVIADPAFGALRGLRTAW